MEARVQGGSCGQTVVGKRRETDPLAPYGIFPEALKNERTECKEEK